MADVKPFRGLRYDLQGLSLIGTDLSPVITPPYDVISPDQQESYYRRAPQNIIRLEFGKEFADDNPRSNKYTRSAQTLNEWLQNTTLIQEESEAFYLVEHRFPFGGGYRSYLGLLARVRLECFETGRIRPTEVIMKKPAADRLDLLRACQINSSPIMGIFDNGDDSLWQTLKASTTAQPLAQGTLDDGITFTLWALTDPEMVEKTSEFFAERVIYIADGHHRYTTALAYRDEQRMAFPEADRDAPFNFIMMTIISSTDPGLVLMPTHRLLSGLAAEDLSGLKEKLVRYFDITDIPVTCADQSEKLHLFSEALEKAGAKGTAFGLYGLEPQKLLLLVPKDADTLQRLMPQEKPDVWRKLDVSILHSVIFEHIMGIDGPDREKGNLSFSADGKYVLDEVDSGRAQLAFLLNPVPTSSVIGIANDGVRMPPKSTYFYPKTAAGLVINPLF